MALQGPFVVVTDSPAPDVLEALRSAGAFPVVETNWADAIAALSSVMPEAVVLADACGDPTHGMVLSKALADRLKRRDGTYMPVVARLREDAAVSVPEALSIAANAPVERIATRLASALRIRTLHSTVLRRARTLATRGEVPPELPKTDPLDEATVLLAGRGRSYPTPVGRARRTGRRSRRAERAERVARAQRP